jgi:hypothetical protein
MKVWKTIKCNGYEFDLVLIEVNVESKGINFTSLLGYLYRNKKTSARILKTFDYLDCHGFDIMKSIEELISSQSLGVNDFFMIDSCNRLYKWCNKRHKFYCTYLSCLNNLNKMNFIFIKLREHHQDSTVPVFYFFSPYRHSGFSPFIKQIISKKVVFIINGSRKFIKVSLAEWENLSMFIKCNVVAMV